MEYYLIYDVSHQRDYEICTSKTEVKDRIKQLIDEYGDDFEFIDLVYGKNMIVDIQFVTKVDITKNK